MWLRILFSDTLCRIRIISYTWKNRLFSFCVPYPCTRVFYSYVINQQMHICKYVQSHVIILKQHVSVTSLIIIIVSHNKNITNIQIIIQRCILKPLCVTFDFFSAP